MMLRPHLTITRWSAWSQTIVHGRFGSCVCVERFLGDFETREAAVAWGRRCGGYVVVREKDDFIVRRADGMRHEPSVDEGEHSCPFC